MNKVVKTLTVLGLCLALGGLVTANNIPGTSFTFPTDTAAKSQAAPFAALLDGSKSVVVQGFQSRELDAKMFKYMGVAGVDKRRIVQVGVSKEDTP